MVPRGVTHISCHQKNTIEGTGENRRTNEQTRTMLGVNSEQKESMQYYISDSIYGLTLAWITSENSTKQLECRHLDSIFFAGPYLLLLCPESTASLRVVSPTSCQLLCPVPTAPVRRSTPTPVSSFLQPTLFRAPLTLPDTARFQVQKPFVWFRAKTDKGIVCLAGHLYSVTH